MHDLALILLAVSLLALAAVIAWWLRSRRPRVPTQPSIQTSIEQMRAIGQLSVFKVVTQEIVTQTDHSWGEFGAKYLSWILSKKKMAIIFEFEIDFRYDLRRPEFQILADGDGRCRVKMPPCFHQAFIRNIQFYDEQRGRVLPWLVPDLLNGFLSAGFTEDDKNRLVAAARSHAEAQARELIANLQSDVRASARTTLEAIAKGFGIAELQFEFDSSTVVDLNVGMAQKLAA